MQFETINSKEAIKEEILKLLDQNNFLTLQELFRELTKKYSKKDIESALESLELIDSIAYGINSEGQETLKITSFGKELLNISKGPNIFDRILNKVIYNPVVRKVLNL